MEATVFSGALVPCGHFGLGQLCVVATLGSRTVKALDVDAPASRGALFAVLGVRGGLELSLSGALALRANVEVGVPLLRSSYTIDGVSRSTTGLVEGSLGAGLLGRF